MIERHGVTAVTYESVAEESGLTKGGLLYHFPSREAMLKALHEHLAAQWEANLISAAGKPADEASAQERLAAYARVAAKSSARAELLLIIEAVNEPDMHAAWRDVIGRWTPPVGDSTVLSQAELQRFTAWLAADGLWLYESLTNTKLHPQMRRQIAEYLARWI